MGIALMPGGSDARAARGFARAPRPAPTRAEAGFTLVEILAVIAILSILMGLMIYGLGRYRLKAYEEGTRGRLQSIRSALEQYQSIYKRYPPDGYDYPVTRADGGTPVAIRGSQCLVYFLGFPTVRTYMVGRERREKEEPPLLDITADMLADGGDLETLLQDAGVELLDRYGNPFRYDCLEKDDDGNVRVTNHSEGGTPDPRGGEGSVSPKGSPGTFDLWSPGADPEDPTDDITSWGD